MKSGMGLPRGKRAKPAGLAGAQGSHMGAGGVDMSFTQGASGNGSRKKGVCQEQ